MDPKLSQGSPAADSNFTMGRFPHESFMSYHLVPFIAISIDITNLNAPIILTLVVGSAST
jgi:hypothetical protein